MKKRCKQGSWLEVFLGFGSHNLLYVQSVCGFVCCFIPPHFGFCFQAEDETCTNVCINHFYIIHFLVIFWFRLLSMFIL